MEDTILKCIWKMSIKDLQRYKCDECGKHFTLNIGLNGHITAVHEKKIQLWSIVHEKDFEFNCDHCGKNNTKHWTKISHTLNA